MEGGGGEGAAWERHELPALTSAIIARAAPPLTAACPATGVQIATRLGKQFARVERASVGVSLWLLANLPCFSVALVIHNHGNNAARVHAFALDSGSPSTVYFCLWAAGRLGGSVGTAPGAAGFVAQNPNSGASVSPTGRCGRGGHGLRGPFQHHVAGSGTGVSGIQRPSRRGGRQPAGCELGTWAGVCGCRS